MSVEDMKREIGRWWEVVGCFLGDGDAGEQGGEKQGAENHGVFVASCSYRVEAGGWTATHHPGGIQAISAGSRSGATTTPGPVASERKSTPGRGASSGRGVNGPPTLAVNPPGSDEVGYFDPGVALVPHATPG